MTEPSSQFQSALASIKCFTDDGTLDRQELNFLPGLALWDEKVNEQA